ncbi:MAG: cache domain-containing protein [Thermodesulfobacteriota bacterium]|nr:cache domain-containing protein [Thermodesulfobacteriota bacterium]
MKRVTIISLALIVGLCLATGAFAADKDAIKKQVDDIVVAIDGGKTAEDFKSAAQNKPYYVFIMEEGGNLLVHPSLVGQSLKEKAEPVYNECAKATADGVWVGYVWKEKQKHTYVRKTKSGLIVGSGYSE